MFAPRVVWLPFSGPTVMGLPVSVPGWLVSGWAGIREPLACVGFWFAHEIVGYIIPDLEKEIVILSTNCTNRNEESRLVGNAAPMSANSVSF